MKRIFGILLCVGFLLFAGNYEAQACQKDNAKTLTTAVAPTWDYVDISYEMLPTHYDFMEVHCVVDGTYLHIVQVGNRLPATKVPISTVGYLNSYKYRYIPQQHYRNCGNRINI